LCGTPHSSSWPPSIFGKSTYFNALANSHDILLLRIENVAKLITETSVESMINSNVAVDIMTSLQLLMDEQRRLVVANMEADNLLAKLIYLFAPVSRIAESLVCEKFL
jgi:hypothetical protein